MTTDNPSTVQPLKVKEVTLFKHGVSFFALKGTVRGTQTVALEFKKNEMNDVLKSLLAIDSSGNGYINRYEEIKQEIEDINNRMDELTKTISARFKKVQV